MRIVFVLAIRVASYSCVLVLNPVQASVVNGVLFKTPSIRSSINRLSSIGRMVDVPLTVVPGLPGWNQKVNSTSQLPHMAMRRACSGSTLGTARSPLGATTDPAWAGTERLGLAAARTPAITAVV